MPAPGGYTWSSHLGNRRVRTLIEGRGQQYVWRHYMDGMPAVGMPLLDWHADTELGADWDAMRDPDGALGGKWRCVVRATSQQGAAAGSPGRPSDVGILMMLRAGRFGMPAEFGQMCPRCGLADADVRHALVEVWRDLAGEDDESELRRSALLCATDLL